MSWSYKWKEAYEMCWNYQLQAYLHTTAAVLHCSLTSKNKLIASSVRRTFNEDLKTKRILKRNEIIQLRKNSVYFTLQFITNPCLYLLYKNYKI
jgi:hypothetical protein